MSWADYEDAVERLAEAREEERLRTERACEQRDQARREIRRVEDDLTNQRRALTKFAERLRASRLSLAGSRKSGLGLLDAFRQADAAMSRATFLLAEAEAAASRTRLLPGESPRTRNVVIDAVMAVLISLATYCGFLIAGLISGPQVWSARFALLPLLLPPALAVLFGCLVINTLGKPEIAKYTLRNFNLSVGIFVSFVICTLMLLLPHPG